MKYLLVTKPGILFGNSLTVVAGFFLAAQTHPNLPLLGWTLLGILLVMGSGCVFNNYIDQDIDKLMKRTKNRAIVQGKLSNKAAILYGIFLALTGLFLLLWKTNVLTTLVAAFGLFCYAVVYSLYYKRKSVHGTLIGAIAGAIPPVVGYTAVSHTLDLGAWILFAILFFWQMPHFYAIAIYRLQEFQAASIPVLPSRVSLKFTKTTMNAFIIGFTLVSMLPTLFGYKSLYYLICALVLGLIWLVIGIQGFFTDKEIPWAKKMFAYSIANITLLSFAMIF